MNKDTIIDIIGSILAIISLALPLIAIVGFLLLVGMLILQIIGVEYESFTHFIMFMVVLFLVSIPIDMFIQPLPKALYAVGKIRKESINLILYPLDFIGNLIAIAIADCLMKSVELPFKTACIFSIILCVANYLFDVMDEK
mgnify:CR=1 FL=1